MLYRPTCVAQGVMSFYEAKKAKMSFGREAAFLLRKSDELVEQS